MSRTIVDYSRPMPAGFTLADPFRATQAPSRRVNVRPETNLWGAPDDPRLSLFADDALPAPSADHIDPDRRDDMAAYVRARAAGIRWYCPGRCTNAHLAACDCPCQGRCHRRRSCTGH